MKYDKNTIEKKITNCILTFEYFKTLFLTEDFKNKINKNVDNRDLIYLHNKLKESLLCLYYAQLRTIFAINEKSNTFKHIDQNLQQKYKFLKNNYYKIKDHINTEVLHIDINNKSLDKDFHGIEDMYNKIIIPLYDLLFDLTSIVYPHEYSLEELKIHKKNPNFIDTKYNIKEYYKIPNISDIFYELIHNRDNK